MRRKGRLLRQVSGSSSSSFSDDRSLSGSSSSSSDSDQSITMLGEDGKKCPTSKRTDID
jgi:hypothetical protein